jgi:hypothetical protein
MLLPQRPSQTEIDARMTFDEYLKRVLILQELFPPQKKRR